MPTIAPMTARWEPGLRPLQRRLVVFGDEVVRAVRTGIENNARIMAADLRRLTPRSDGDGDHVADGWAVRPIDAGGGRDGSGRFVARADFGVEVFNENPRFDAPIEVSTGGVTSLGLILEYGSRPHTIEAKPGKVLAFFWPAVGRMVYTKKVEHPGTRPYGMMAVATSDAIDRGQRLMDAVRRVLGEVKA